MTKSPRLSAIALGCALTLAACGGNGERIDAAANGLSETPDKIANTTEADGLPGLPATRSDGCVPAEVPGDIASYPDWVPINQVVNYSGQVMVGSIVDISNPRITSLDAQPEGGRVDYTYFRILTLEVDARSFGMTQEGPKADERLQVMMFGSGTDTDPEILCYGWDGIQDARTLPLQKGDEVVALLTLRSEYPMVNPPNDILVVDDAIFGLWKIEEGVAVSGVEGYDLETGALLERLRTEFARGEVPYEEIAQVDGLSKQPERKVDPVPSTIPPGPPPIDAESTPTVPTPPDLLEEMREMDESEDS